MTIAEVPVSDAPGTYLLRRSDIIADESLQGYLLRVASENGFTSAHVMMRYGGVSLRVATHRSDLSRLSTLVGHSAERLQAITYWPGKGRPRQFARFFGSELRNFHLQVEPCRVCPDCLSEQSYCRAIWDVRLASICAIHRKLLLERCASCANPISWRRSEVSTCGHCGGDFRAMKPAEATAGAADLCGLMFDRIAPNGPLAAEGRDFPSFCWEISPIQLLELIRFLGGYALDPTGSFQQSRLPRRDPERLHALLNEAARALADWPAGFHVLLDDIRKKNSAVATRTGLSGQFGDFYITLMRRFSLGPLSALKDAFLEYIHQSGGDAYATRRGFKYFTEQERGFMSRPEVAEALGISAQTVDVLVRGGEISGQIRPMGLSRSYGVFDRSSIEQYKERRKFIISSEAAAQILGISRRDYRQLVDGGLLEPSARATFRYRKAYEIDRRKIDGLLTSLNEKADPTPNSIDLAFHAAATELSKYGMSGADLLKKALTSEVRVTLKKPSDVGLRRLAFSAGDVQRAIRQFEKRMPPSNVVENTANQLKVEPPVVYRLLAGGVLRTRQEPGRTPQICSRELSRFRRRYIAAHMIASAKKTTPRGVLELFAGAGVSPVIGRTVDLSFAFFDRKDAQRVIGTC